MNDQSHDGTRTLQAQLAALGPGLDQLALPACVLDTQLCYRHVNAAYCTHFGRAAADLLGRTPSQAFAVEPSDQRRDMLRRALAGEACALDRETLQGERAGSWLRAHYMPVRDGDEVIGVAVVLVDIQPLRDSQHALAERERQLSLITDSVGFPITYLDRDGIVRFANRPSCEWAGRAPAEMLGRHVNELSPPEVCAFTAPYLARALAGEHATYERSAHWPGREDRRIRGHMIPDKDAAGEVRGVLVVIIDIEADHQLQLELLDKTRRLQMITENVGMPMSYIDSEWRFRYTNQTGLDWLPQRTAEGVNGKHLSEVFPPEVMAVVQGHIARALTGEKVVYERHGTNNLGERKWIRVHLIPDAAEDGTVRGIYSVVVDIDQDQRLRHALVAQEEKLRFFTDNIPEAIAWVDTEWRYRFANKVFQRIRGQGEADIIGHTVSEVLGEDIARRVFEPFIPALHRGETCSYERQVGPPGAEGRWMLVRLVPQMNPEGVFEGLYVVSSDIHDMKLAQERLAHQESQLRLFTDNIPESVAYLDRDRRYVFVNRTFAEQRGMKLEEIVGKTSAEVLGQDAADQMKPLVARVHGGETITYERLMTLASGEKRWIHGRSVPDRAPDGSVRGHYVVGHDVHELKIAQEMLREREEEMRFFAENIPEAIVYIDLERGCTFVNNIFLATRGFTREFALGKFPPDVYPAELMESLAPYLERVVQGHSQVYEREIRIAATGEVRWVRVKLTPRKDDAGKVLGYYVVSNDVHDLKSAQQALEDKERELRQVIDSIPTPMAYVDADIRYRYVNDAFLGYIGMAAGQVIGQTVRDVLGHDRWGFFSPFLERLKNGESLSVERLIHFADGRERWMIVRLTPRMDTSGRFLGYYATTSDIHEQKVVEEELRRANSILSAHFDNTPLAVIEWDPGMHVVRWSGEAAAIFGWGASETLGRALDGWRIVFEEDEESVATMLRRLIAGPGSQATILNRNYRKDGSVIWVEWHNSALRDESGRVISILSLAQDVSSRIQAEERLQYMATHDGLTGLPNRVLLNDRLESAIARARRAQHRVAVMFLDLDHFKDVNDTLGHRVGDELLKDLSRRIRATLRQSDLLVRIAGDEFVVVLEDLEGDEGPERVAQKVLDDVMRPFHLDGHDVHVSASLGFAVFPNDGDDPDTLLKNADAAMYHAKELGRNSFRAFSASLGERRKQRREVEAALRRALKGDELELHYQPIVEIGDGVKRVEALIRWRDPERGLVLPGAFIPLAEEIGLVHELGLWVLDAACRQVRKWHDAGITPMAVCVNLSAGQLRDSTMVGEVKGALDRTGCDPSWLEFEVTETSMVRDLEGASLTLAKFRRLGVRIAIDDFGTGFSSLSHLRHLPVDTLKIDKAFVADIDAGGRSHDAGGAAIVSAVIGLARGLGLDVIAEGVERQSQLDFLTVQGCGACQGYLLCPPVTAAEFEKWLRARSPAKRKRAATKKKKAAKR